MQALFIFFSYFKIREKNMPCYEEKNDFLFKISSSLYFNANERRPRHHG